MKRTRLRPGRGFAASPAQREAVAGRPCIVCGGEPCDPAHVVSRGLGGCEDPLCVVPLDRACHEAYDQHRLNLLPHLEPGWRPQLAHAVAHLGVVGALRRISGPGFHPSGHAFAPPNHAAPQLEDRLPEVLSESEVLALIAACPPQQAGIRNRALIASIWCCGLKTSEALELQLAHLDLDRLTLAVRGRPLGLDPHTGTLLQSWLDCRQGLAITTTHLFCTLTGGPLQPAYLRGLLPRLSRNAGLSRTVTPRLLRCGYAVDLLRDGAPLQVLTAALGHSSPSVTARHLRRIQAREIQRSPGPGTRPWP